VGAAPAAGTPQADGHRSQVFSVNKPGGNVIAVCIDHNDDTVVVAISSEPAPAELRAAS